MHAGKVGVQNAALVSHACSLSRRFHFENNVCRKSLRDTPVDRVDALPQPRAERCRAVAVRQVRESNDHPRPQHLFLEKKCGWLRILPERGCWHASKRSWAPRLHTCKHCRPDRQLLGHIPFGAQHLVKFHLRDAPFHIVQGSLYKTWHGLSGIPDPRARKMSLQCLHRRFFQSRPLTAHDFWLEA